MEKKNATIRLPEGNFDVPVLFFENSDRAKLKELFENWNALNKLCEECGSTRKVNLPEALTEGIFCIETGAVRFIESIPNANTSFDCYNLQTQKRIQIKGTSSRGPTSFGPKSVWDELYLVDFYNDKNVDGTYKIYLINTDIKDIMMNTDETFQQQQEQRRRPRFNLYKDIIEDKGIEPIYMGKL